MRISNDATFSPKRMGRRTNPVECIAVDSQTVEIIGRNFLVSQLVRDGVEVARPERDHGIDLIAYSHHGGIHLSGVALVRRLSRA
jgi:hypothetical protein